MPHSVSNTNLPVPLGGRGRAVARLDRQIEQHLATLHGQALVARAEDKVRYTLSRERVSDLQALTQQGLLAATEISMVEQFCADRAPHASGRLAHIANAGCGAIAQNVFDFGQGR